MPEDRLLNVFKVLTGLWSIFILIVVSVPGQSIQKISSMDFPGLDKLIHFMLFAVLNTLALRIVVGKDFDKRKRIVFLQVCGFAIFTECIQILLSDRFFEIFDIIANIMGVLVAQIIFIKNLN